MYGRKNIVETVIRLEIINTETVATVIDILLSIIILNSVYSTVNLYLMPLKLKQEKGLLLELDNIKKTALISINAVL